VSEPVYPEVSGVGRDGWEKEDNGTMPKNVSDFAEQIVGHRIVEVLTKSTVDGVQINGWDAPRDFKGRVDTVFVLDNGRKVGLDAGGDCCAFTGMREVIQHLPSVDHIITAVRPETDYETWHIVADFGDVMDLLVDWSPGNPFYYGYGFDIIVQKEEA
jgi:hypothetical protein